MTEDDFKLFLKNVKISSGELLCDQTTYKFYTNDLPKNRFTNQLPENTKVLVLTDGNFNVVGGILFYRAKDIQVYIFPNHRRKGYMRAVHANGILRNELYPEQQVSLHKWNIRTLEDFLCRQHLLSLIGLIPNNLSEIYKWLILRKQINCTEKEFIQMYT